MGTLGDREAAARSCFMKNHPLVTRCEGWRFDIVRLGFFHLVSTKIRVGGRECVVGDWQGRLLETLRRIKVHGIPGRIFEETEGVLERGG